MAKEKELKAKISLVDNYTKNVDKIIKKTGKLAKVANSIKKIVIKADDKASKAISKVSNSLKKLKGLRKFNVFLKTKDGASKVISKVRGNLRKLRSLKTVKMLIDAKDKATFKIGKVLSKAKAITGKVRNMTIAAKDKASAVLGKLKGAMSTLAKGLIIPITASVGVAKGAMDLETQKVSIRHFMGVGNKGKSSKELDKMSSKYFNDLRKNANTTPFETGEVMKVGARGLQIAEGNVKGAMKYVKLAEGMAAMNPGKTVSDAMEAIADMNMGEYARLTEFGVKATKEGGDTPKSVLKKLQDTYKGGAEKLAETAKGKFSTVMGTFKSAIADFGTAFLPMLSGAFENLTKGLNSVTPKLMEFSSTLADKIGNIDWGGLFASFDLSTVTNALAPVVGLFEKFFSGIETKSPTTMGIMQILGTVFNTVWNGIGAIIKAVSPIIEQVFSFIGQHGEEISNIIKGFGVIWQAVWGVVGVLLKAAWAVAKPLLSALLSLLDKLSSAIQAVGRWWQNMCDKINNNPIVATVKKVFTGDDGKKSKKKGKRSAFGTRRVFGNEVPFRLHDGERVLTKSESKMLDNQRMNSVNVTVNGLTVREEADIDKIATKLVKKINQNKILLGGV